MKKSFLFLLISIMTVFLIAGCAEDTTKGGSNTETPTDPALVEQIKQFTEGYYEITFFYTDGAGIMPISSSCTEAGNKGLINKSCTEATMKGYGQITVDSNGGINLVTKIQMDLSSLGALYETAKDSQYNYTVYPRIPASSIDMTDLGTKGLIYINKNGGINGTSGRDLSKNVSDDTATYSFEYSASGTITNTMTTKAPMPNLPAANVIVEMKQINALPENYTMDKNTLFPTPQINDFVANPQ